MSSASHFKLESESQVKNISELKFFWKKSIDQFFQKKALCLLVGPVGSGKTESLKQIYDLYGFKDAASPSFAIHHQSRNQSGQILDHVDLYRIKDQDDLESTGFWDLFQSQASWIFVEWADLISLEAWPANWGAC